MMSSSVQHMLKETLPTWKEIKVAGVLETSCPGPSISEEIGTLGTLPCPLLELSPLNSRALESLDCLPLPGSPRLQVGQATGHPSSLSPSSGGPRSLAWMGPGARGRGGEIGRQEEGMK